MSDKLQDALVYLRSAFRDEEGQLEVVFNLKDHREMETAGLLLEHGYIKFAGYNMKDNTDSDGEVHITLNTLYKLSDIGVAFYITVNKL